MNKLKNKVSLIGRIGMQPEVKTFDSGKTLIKSIKWLELFYGFYLEEKVKTAVLWHKEQSQFKPDYSVEFLKGSPWIHMPFEKYETTNIKDFKI